MRIALVHDWLNQYGGAERVLEVLHDMYPAAPVFASMYAPGRMPDAYRRWDIRTTFMQRLPGVTSRHQMYLLLYPFAFERLRLYDFDLVISNSSGFCHGIQKGAHTTHINYCLTPPRYVWSLEQYLNRERIGGVLRRVLRLFVPRLQRWDVQAASRVDRFVGISKAVVERIKACYGREADLIYPPVDTDGFHMAPKDELGDYFLVASRLVPYKRVDLAVRAFSELGLPLLVAGDGRDRPALEAMAGPSVRFLGYVPQDELRRLLARCRAFLFPGEEDFGIAPVEAMASGRPVIAYAAGGALDTVLEGRTGLLFHEQTPESLAHAVREFNDGEFDPASLRRFAEGFATPVFREAFGRLVDRPVETKAGS